MGFTPLGLYSIPDTNVQIDDSIFSSKRGLSIVNFDCATAITAGSYYSTLGRAPEAMKNLYNPSANSIALGADVRGKTNACVFDGTAYLVSKPHKKIIDSTGTWNVSVEVKVADWDVLGADQNLISEINAAGTYGWRMWLKYSDSTLHVSHYNNSATPTNDLSYDISGLVDATNYTFGYKSVPGVGHTIYVNGVSVASDTDTSDVIGSQTDATIGTAITAISNAKSAVITTSSAHGLTTGDIISLSSIVGTMDLHGMDTLNGNSYKATNIGTYTFSIPVDSTNFDSWVSGGTVKYTYPTYFSIGADYTGAHPFTGSMDELVLQYNATWADDDFKLLHYTPRTTPIMYDAAGVLKVISVS